VRQVRIFYTRPPLPPRVYEQRLVYESTDALVTLGLDLDIGRPKVVGGQVAMEPGGSIVWFTFPGRWHDIGKSYLRDGSFAGTYANILTPVQIVAEDVWRTTDLYLDVWLPPNGAPVLLDQEALRHATRRGSISAEWANQAEREAAVLMNGAKDGTWPPQIVQEWDLNRALAAVEPG